VTTQAPHPSSTPSTFGHSSTTTAPTHPPTTTTTSTTTTTTITHPTTTKTQCVQCLCQYENGLFSLSWTETKDAVNFVFKTTALQKENIWAAFSLSSDDQMGQDDVHLCKAATNLKTVEHYYNNNQEPPNILVPSNPTIGLSNIQVNLNDNVLTCNFTRLKSLSHIQNYFDMKNPYYLLFSTGPLDQLGKFTLFFLYFIAKECEQMFCYSKLIRVEQQSKPTVHVSLTFLLLKQQQPRQAHQQLAQSLIQQQL